MPNPEDQEARMRMDADVASKVQKDRFYGKSIPEMMQKPAMKTELVIDPIQLRKVLDAANAGIEKLAVLANTQQEYIKTMAKAHLALEERVKELEGRQDPDRFNKVLTEDETQALFDAIAAPARDEEEETRS